MLGSLEMEWPGSTRDRATPTFNRRDEAVYFLCHFPSGRPDRVLPGTLPCGVRTFLPPSRLSALRPTIVWPAANSSLYRVLASGSRLPASGCRLGRCATC